MSWLGRRARGRVQFIRLELVAAIKMEGDPRRFGLERVRVNAMDNGYNSFCVARILERKALGTQKEDDTRPRCALRQLGVQHLIDLPKMRVGSVSTGLAAAERQQKRNRKQEKTEKKHRSI
jgi:hypothetical protein